MCFDEADFEQCTFSNRKWGLIFNGNMIFFFFILLAYENILLSLWTIQEFIVWRAAKLKLQQKLQAQGTKEIQFF